MGVYRESSSPHTTFIKLIELFGGYRVEISDPGDGALLPSRNPQAVDHGTIFAWCLDFGERLPEGLATPLGESGVKLSGGERQRVAIARASLADREVLLLDEATSALDAESKRMVQAALEAALNAGERQRTTLVIAHRLATVQKSDRTGATRRRLGAMSPAGSALRAGRVTPSS